MQVASQYLNVNTRINAASNTQNYIISCWTFNPTTGDCQKKMSKKGFCIFLEEKVYVIKFAKKISKYKSRMVIEKLEDSILSH